MSRPWCRFVLTKKYTDKEVDEKLETCINFARKNFPESGCYSLQWLESVLILADKLWFDSKLLKGVAQVYGGLDLCIDNSEQRVAGYVRESYDKNGVSFHMNRNLFAELFRTPPKRKHGYHSGGLLCKDRMVCALHVILHEMVHLALTLCEKIGFRDDRNEHGTEFQKIVWNFFRHTDPQHGLIPGYEQYHDLDTIRKSIKRGQTVEVFIDNKWTTCTVARKGKKSTRVITAKGEEMTVHPGLIRLCV